MYSEQLPISQDQTPYGEGNTQQVGTSGGWMQVQNNVGNFHTQMHGMQGEGGGNSQPYYFAGQDHLAAMYGGQVPSPGFFEQLQYLPMNANFYMPPGAGLPYMDPYGIMNPAALPPVLAPTAPKKATPKKEKSRCC